MTLRHLEIFIKVYENQSITQTAHQMHLAQPSISLAIKELEEYYHLRLFDRMNRKIYPTSIAHQFYQYAIHIISLFSEMEEGLLNWEESGTMKIGSSITIGHYILPQILQLLKEKYPHIHFQIFIHNSETIEEYILENKIDFALIETEAKNENIEQIPFMSDHLCTIVSLDHPLLQKKKVQLNELIEYPILMREKGSSVSNLVESVFITHQVPFHPIMESISTQAIINSVEANLGISTLPYMLVKQSLEQQQIAQIHVKELNIKRTYHIIYHKNKYISKVAQEFFEICQTYKE